MALPELLGPIQAQLLDLVSVVLAGRPLRDNLPPPLLQALHQAVQHGQFPVMPVQVLEVSTFPLKPLLACQISVLQCQKVCLGIVFLSYAHPECSSLTALCDKKCGTVHMGMKCNQECELEGCLQQRY